MNARSLVAATIAALLSIVVAGSIAPARAADQTPFVIPSINSMSYCSDWGFSWIEAAGVFHVEQSLI